MKSFIFIGGDSRSIYAAEKLGERYCCTLYGISGEEKLPESLSDYAVLPLPASTDGVHINCPLIKSTPPEFDILEKTVKKGGTVFTSKEFPALCEICLKNGFSLVNYFEREELAVKNAVPTAAQTGGAGLHRGSAPDGSAAPRPGGRPVALPPQIQPAGGAVGRRIRARPAAGLCVHPHRERLRPRRHFQRGGPGADADDRGDLYLAAQQDCAG